MIKGKKIERSGFKDLFFLMINSQKVFCYKPDFSFKKKMKLGI